MDNRWKWLRRVFIVGVWSCLVIFSFLNLLLPTRIVQRLLTSHIDSLNQFAPYGQFSILLCALLCYWLSRVCDSFNPSSPSPKNKPSTYSPITSWAIAIQIALSAVIVVRTVAQINVPFDYDEQVAAATMTQETIGQIINPLRSTSYHPLGGLASHLSMQILGISRIKARIPAVVMSVLFLVVLNLLLIRFASIPTRFLLLAHLAANQSVIWYLHSMRGYVPMMLLALIPLWIFVEALEPKIPARPNTRRVLLALCLLVSVFVHAFAGIFCLLLVASAILWLGIQYQTMPEANRKYFLSLILTSVLISPVVVGVVGYLFTATHAKNEVLFQHVGVVTWRNYLEPLFGVARDWWIKLLLLMTGILFVLARGSSHKKERTFLGCFLMLSAVTLAMTRILLETTFEGRFMLPFLVPTLLWLGESMALLESGTVRRIAYAAAAIILIYAPITNSSEVLRARVEQIDTYQTFIAKVREKTRPAPLECFKITGATEESGWSSSFYLRDSFNQNSRKGPSFRCELLYSLHFPEYLERMGRVSSKSSAPTAMDILVSDNEGRTMKVRQPQAPLD